MTLDNVEAGLVSNIEFVDKRAAAIPSTLVKIGSGALLFMVGTPAYA
jgi:hypothetical protein